VETREVLPPISPVQKGSAIGHGSHPINYAQYMVRWDNQDMEPKSVVLLVDEKFIDLPGKSVKANARLQN
jgi:hypothetical protein